MKKNIAALASASAMMAFAPRSVFAAPRADASDPKVLLSQLQSTFQQFKDENDARVAAKADDAVVNEKLDRMNETIGNLQAALDDQARIVAAGGIGRNPGAPADPEYSELFASYFVNGAPENEEKLRLAHRSGTPRASMTEGSQADGGYMAPVEWDRTIAGRLKLLSPIRQESTVQTISKSGFTKLFTDRAVGSGWVTETGARPATSTPQFTALSFSPGELYANAATSQTIIDDAEIDLASWLTGEIEAEFARQEGIAFISGDGSNKPYGLLTYVTGAANAARHPWGAIAVTNSGTAALVDKPDALVSLVGELPAVYEGNSKFFMNRKTCFALRKLKDGQNNYIWQPSYALGTPQTILGRPVTDTPDMPDIAANAFPILFGDMAETYLVVDRTGVRVLRDPYTNKPYICFYVTRRVGGGVKNPDSMKALKVSA